MPVVSLELGRFSKMVGADKKKIMDRLPYIGLDIESIEGSVVRVEYSPNRPDFGTDLGIARALRGIMGLEVGLPEFKTKSSGITVSVDRRLAKVRPFIACAAVTGLTFDDEDIRQIMSLQEDLHNGLGRRRRVVAIGLHDMKAVKPPISYRAVDSRFKFVPLGGKGKVPIGKILSQTPEGKSYGQILRADGPFPVITDSAETLLSFPPVINGNATAVTTKTTDVFIDVTSTDQKTGDDVLAVLTTTLAAAGGGIQTVSVKYGSSSRTTPDLKPVGISLDRELVRSVLGMDLSIKEIHSSLAKSRLGIKNKQALGGRYRVDLLHPVDVAEEVALGYGMDRIGPVYPPSKQPGIFNHFEQFLDSVSTLMAGSGMIELMTFELTEERSLYSNFGRSPASKVSVQDPKSLDHSVLRDSLLPTMMASLSSNVKSDYPQRVYEIGRVYTRSGDGVSETFNLGCLIAHSQATFSEAKMHLEAFCRTMTGKEPRSRESEHWGFSQGRCASVSLSGKSLGYVGEMGPAAITAFGIKVPVAGFELGLTTLHELLK